MVFPHKHFDDQPEISRTALELEANGTDVLSCPEGPAVIALERKPAPAWRIGSAMSIYLTIWHGAADWGTTRGAHIGRGQSPALSSLLPRN
jgi:hypothetical protein